MPAVGFRPQTPRQQRPIRMLSNGCSCKLQAIDAGPLTKAQSSSALQLRHLTPALSYSRLLLPLLLAAAASAPGVISSGLPCERSGYCSLGRTRPYVGEVESALGLSAALASRSFKREVILMAAAEDDNTLPVMQALAGLHRLGLEHVLLLGPSGPDCVRLAAAAPSVGCSWLEFSLPVFGAERAGVAEEAPMWHNRFRLAARIVRLRYNPLLLDLSTLLFDDPYVALKSPPFANYTVITQAELSYDESSYSSASEPSSGLLYVQNAAPDGPAAWMMAEVVHRLLRWIEDGFNLTRTTHHIATSCGYGQDDGLRDALTSVRAGRIFFGSTLRDCRTAEWQADHVSSHASLVSAVQSELAGAGAAFASSQLDLPLGLRAVAGASSVEGRHVLLRLPAYTPWNSSCGPWLYPAGRGLLSRQWMKQLQEDCRCPLWPDPEDPASASSPSASSTRPPESLLLAPPFLTASWTTRGRRGYWLRALSPEGARQVVGSLQAMPGPDAALSQSVVRMTVGQYDWTLARQVRGHRLYGMHAGGSAVQPGPESQPGGPPPLHLLALHPSLLAALGATGSWREYSALLAGLAQAAAALQRVPVWPDVPCSAPWVSEGGAKGATSLPLNIHKDFIPYGRRRGALSCMWLPLLSGSCLHNGGGMLSLEWGHWRAQQRAAGAALEPGAHNTIGRTVADMDPAPTAANSTNPMFRIFSVAADEVARAWSLRKTHAQRVLYLLSPLSVTHPAGTRKSAALERRLNECPATNPAAVEADLLDPPPSSQRPTPISYTPAAISPSGLLRRAPAIPGYNVPHHTTVQSHEPTHQSQRSQGSQQSQGSQIRPQDTRAEGAAAATSVAAANTTTGNHGNATRPTEEVAGMRAHGSAAAGAVPNTAASIQQNSAPAGGVANVNVFANASTAKALSGGDVGGALSGSTTSTNADAAAGSPSTQGLRGAGGGAGGGGGLTASRVAAAGPAHNATGMVGGGNSGNATTSVGDSGATGGLVGTGVGSAAKKGAAGGAAVEYEEAAGKVEATSGAERGGGDVGAAAVAVTTAAEEEGAAAGHGVETRRDVAAVANPAGPVNVAARPSVVATRNATVGDEAAAAAGLQDLGVANATVFRTFPNATLSDPAANHTLTVGTMASGNTHTSTISVPATSTALPNNTGLAALLPNAPTTSAAAAPAAQPTTNAPVNPSALGTAALETRKAAVSSGGGGTGNGAAITSNSSTTATDSTSILIAPTTNTTEADLVAHFINNNNGIIATDRTTDNQHVAGKDSVATLGHVGTATAGGGGGGGDGGRMAGRNRMGGGGGGGGRFRGDGQRFRKRAHGERGQGGDWRVGSGKVLVGGSGGGELGALGAAGGLDLVGGFGSLPGDGMADAAQRRQLGERAGAFQEAEGLRGARGEKGASGP